MGRIRFSPVLFAITALGISSVVTQISLTRELLNIANGNELVVGLVIAVWLLLTGAGAWLGELVRRDRTVLVVSLVATAFLPFAHVLAIRALPGTVATRGVGVGPYALLLTLPVLLGPYCLLSGSLLTIACSLLSRRDDPLDIGVVYVADNLGDIAGGALFSFVLVYLTDTFGALYLPAVLTVAAAGSTAWFFGHRRAGGVLLLCLALVGGVALSGVNTRSLAWLFPGQQIEDVVESPYGRLVTTRDAEQINVYEDGIPLASSADVRDAEETVHFALSQLPRRELRVLLVSGGMAGVAREALKYPTDHIDYVELDPAVVEMAQALDPSLSDHRVTAHAMDGRRFVGRTDRTYDAVLMDLPPPSSIQINRFYTQEFFQEVKRHLAPDGVVGMSLPGAENYINDELAALLTSVCAAARAVFGNVAAYPAGKTVVVFSDAPLGYAIGDSLEAKGIATQYVNAYYLAGVLTRDRVRQVSEHTAAQGPPNSDLHPHAFRWQLGYRLALTGTRLGWLFAVLTIGLVLFVVLSRASQTAVATTGFASIAMELVVLLLFQVHAGYVYRSYGLMVTVFMAGLAVGAWGSNIRLRTQDRRANRYSLIALDGAVAALALSAAWATACGAAWRNVAVLYLFLFAVACVSGAQFPVAAALGTRSVRRVAGGLYAADLGGAAVGSVLCALMLIPALGVPLTLVVLGALKIVSMGKTMLSR